jgi:hypothetical protein
MRCIVSKPVVSIGDADLCNDCDEALLVHWGRIPSCEQTLPERYLAWPKVLTGVNLSFTSKVSCAFFENRPITFLVILPVTMVSPSTSPLGAWPLSALDSMPCPTKGVSGSE